MKLEQQMYRIPNLIERTYTIGDLENLSVGVLYTGHLPPMGPGGFGLPKGDSYEIKPVIFETPQIKISMPNVGETLPGGLVIKDLLKNSAVLQQDFGGVGNIYTAHPDSGGSTRFYGIESIKGIKRGKDRATKDIWEKSEDDE